MKELMNIIEKIEEKYPNHVIIDEDKLLELYQSDDKLNFIETLQELSNSLYEEIGFNEDLLDLQIYINTLRFKFDITDPREVIRWDNGKGFVQ